MLFMDFFEVLSDGTRRRIVEILTDGDRPAGELADAFEITQPGISRHLRILREAGMVESRRAGRKRIYSLKPEMFDEVDGWVRARKNAWNRRLDALESHLARGVGGGAPGTLEFEER